MTNQTMYERVKKLLKLAWQNDDIMEQETLFEMQDGLAQLLLDIANEIGTNECQDDLIKSFPYLFKEQA